MFWAGLICVNYINTQNITYNVDYYDYYASSKERNSQITVFYN